MAVQIIHYDQDGVASQALIRAMIGNVGWEGEEAIAAVDVFARFRIAEADGELTMGDLELESGCFVWGYNQCLVNHGLMEPNAIGLVPLKK